MEVKGVLTIHYSKRDRAGNVYYAYELHGDYGLIEHGKVSADNIDTRDCRENLKWLVNYHEVGIRDFNRMTKNWPYIGCLWPEIKANLTKSLKSVEVTACCK